MTYSESIEWLYSTQLFGIKLGLDGPKQLLKEYLAYPDYGVKVIHIAGTNGKGSTCAMIDSIARAAGHRTGLFTSPHLIDFRERIRVSGVEIPEENCAAMLTELRGLCASMDPHPTFFEIALVLAMRWFRERGCDLIVLETGMGGRLDATTAVPADVCGITPIALDHTQWLGDTIEKIAAEKAGIFLEGKPAISAPQENGVVRVLEREANERRTPLSFVTASLMGYPIALPGTHQKWNAALAVECLHAANLRLDYDVIHHGLSSVSWPGRFERLDYRGQEVILDGAHNPQGAAVLAETWSQEFGERKCTLVFSAVAAKDVAGILSFLSPLAERIHLCAVDTPRALPAAELALDLPEGAPSPICHPGLQEALEAAISSGHPVLIAGSLFLVGEAKALIQGGDFQSSTQ